MSDATDRGITVTEIVAMGHTIDTAPETTAAFVGRALRGPLNTPVPVRNFGEFRRRFGDIWPRSSLGPAVQQFFEHGGRNLYIVRVANNARGAMLCLPAGDSALSLRALEPGSTERVRAAVDYDGIKTGDNELFNLTLQRVDPGTGLVIDQELYRRLSCIEASDAFVADALLTSSMARVERPYPSDRPDATIPGNVRPGSAYMEHIQEGSDGTELSDYDLVGAREQGSGLFALQQVDQFDLLYLPPPGKQLDLGPAAILAAEMYCRERGAMLILDPAAAWRTPDEAVRAVRAQGYASPNMIAYYPRMARRGDDAARPRAVGGALAGMLCKLDRMYGPWRDTDRQGLGFSRALVPAADVDSDDARVLAREGINVIASGAAGGPRLKGAVTMARGSDLQRTFTNLGVRRLCLSIVNAIEKATRWAVFEQPDERQARQVQGQVLAYLGALADLGAFADDRVDVQCDAGLCKKTHGDRRGISIVITFQPHGCSKPISFTLHQSVEGYRVASTAFAPAID